MDTFIKNKAIKIFLAALLPLIISCSGRTYKDALEYFNLDSTVTSGSGSTSGGITLDTGSDTGHINTDGVTNDSTPTISGSGLNPGDEVIIYSDNPAANTELGRAIVDSSGNWTWTLTPGDTTMGGAPANQLTTIGGALADGTHNLTYIVKDSNGTESTGTTSFALTVDTLWGGANPGSAADLDAASDTGSSSTDNITSDTTPTLTGTGAPAGEYVYVYDNGTLIGSVQINGTGGWSFTPTTSLTEGLHNLTYYFGDLAGNLSTVSATLAVTIDSSPPADPAAVLNLVDASDSGISNTDNLTNDDTPTLSGSGLTTGDIVIIYADNPAANTELGRAIVDAGGNWTWTLTPGDTTMASAPANQLTNVAALSSGAYNLTYVVSDTAGNTSSASPAIAVNIDKDGATHSSSNLVGNNYIDITFNEGVYGGNGTSGGALIPADLLLTFAANGGTATGANITSITNTSGGALTGGETTIRVNFSVTGVPSGSETIAISAVASSVYDAAGNASSFTTGTQNLLSTGVAVITGTPAYTAVAPITGGTTGYIEVSWSEGVYTTTGSSGAVIPADFNVTFTQNAGTSTNAVISCITDVTSTSCPGVPVAAGATSMRLQISNTGVTSGTETIQVAVASNQIYSSADNATPTSVNTNVLSFPDRVAPVVTNVTSVTANSTYKANDTISIQVVFSENVLISGTPQLTLSTGTPPTTAVNFVSLTGGNTLNFTYTVVTGNESSDLDYASTSALSAGTYIRDSANNNATLTLAAPGAATSLGNNKAIVIDAVAPAAPGTPDLIAASDSGTNTDNVTSDTTPTFTVSCEDGASVQLFDDGISTGTAAVCAASTVTLTAATVAEGVNAITAVQTDGVGNASVASTALSITIDTTAPSTPASTATLAAASDTGVSSTDGITTDSTPTFSGTGTPGDYVVIYSNNPAPNTELGRAIVDGSGNWTWTLTPGDSTYAGAPADQLTTAAGALSGTHSITYTAMDAAGNQSTHSPGFTLQVDTSAPGAPAGTADLVASTDSGVSNTDNTTTNNSTIELTGTGAVANALVRIYSGATEIGQAIADGSGNWTWTMTPGDVTLAGAPANMATLVGSLSEGGNAITYRTEDLAGNLSPASTGTLNVTVDTTAPAINTSTVSGTSSYIDINMLEGVYGGDGTSGGGVNAADLGIIFAANGGTATGASIACVTTTASTSCPGVAPSGGETTVRVILNVTGTPSGTETITVSANSSSVYDAAGNASTFTTGAKTLNVAGIANITAATLESNNAYVTITFDEAAYSTTGTSGALDTTDFTVNITTNTGGNVTGATLTSVTNNAGGALTGGETQVRVYFTLTGGSPAGLAAGVETIRINAASNAIYAAGAGVTPASENSGELTLNDKLPPGAPSALDLAAADDTGVSDSDNNTTQATALTVSGTAVANSTVRLYQPNSGGTLLATVVADGSGNWNTDISLTAGSTYTVIATATDTANNTSADSTALTITVDTSAPAAPATMALAGADDTGTLNNDGITRNTSGLTVTGTSEANATIRLYQPNTSGTLLQTVTADGSGNWSADIALAEGSYTVVATATDPAGNLGVASGNLNLTIDTTAPNNQDTVYAASSSRTGGGAVTIVSSGTASNEVWLAPSGTTTFTAGATMTKAASGTATSILAPATDGSYKLFVLDLAGNISSESTATLTVESTLPVISSVSPATNDYRNSTQVSYTLSETCASGSVTFTQTGGTADGGSPHTQALTGSELTVGTKTNITLTNNPTLVSGAIYSVAFDCTDLAGNVATTVTSTNVRFDTTLPVISSVSPAAPTTNVNSTQVGYTLSEVCASGNITWTRTGGTADGGSPHTQALTGSELNAGSFSGTLTNNPTLVDNAIYSIAFNCTDLAGNVATTITSTNITFDAGVLQISSAETLDTDADGKIDTYRVTFNKSVNDSTFPGYSANALGSVTSAWLIAGYTNVRMLHGSAVTFATDTINDAVIYIRFDESLLDCNSTSQVGCDTAAKPDLTTTASPGIQDLATNTITQVNTAAVTESDSAPPILVAARPIGPTTVYSIFSEIPETTTAQDSVNYTISGSGGLTVSNAVINGSNQKIVELTTSAQTGGSNYTLTVNTAVKDLANRNIPATANTANFTGIEKPVVVSIVTTSATTLRITFNETVTAASTECSNTIDCAVIYQNISLPVISAVSNAGAGINSTQFNLTVNSMVEGQSYTTSVLVDTVTSVASGQKMGSTNNSDTFTGDGRPAANISLDTATACPANGPQRRVIIQYDQTVGASATTITNYKITGCITGDCATGTGSPNSVGAATVTDEGGNKYAVNFTDPFDSDSSQYQLTISGVQDSNGNTIAAPGNLTFQCGTDTTPPSLIGVNIVSATAGATVALLTFSESVDSVTANISTNYKYDSNAYGFQVSTAARQTNTAQVQVTFAPGIPNGGHQMRVQLVQDLTSNAIIDNGVNNVQPFIVNAPTGFTGGSVFNDPFNDGTTAGTMIVYDGKFYLGADTAAAKLFETDFALTSAQTITLDADGVFGLPYEDFNGYATKWSGCPTYTYPGTPCTTGNTISGVDTIYAACVGGTSTPKMTGSVCTGAGGTETLFIGALNTMGNYRSFWYTTTKSSVNTNFTFTEEWSGDTGGGAAYRSANMVLFKDQLFVNFGAELGGGGRGGRICMNPAGCTGAVNSAYLSQVGFPTINRLQRIGAATAGSNPYRNGSYNRVVGYSDTTTGADGQVLNAINVMYEYDNDGTGGNESQLYLANGGFYTGTLGSARVTESDGGIVRTTLTYSAKNSLPRDCASSSPAAGNGCSNFFQDVTPDANAKWNAYLSIPYPQNSAVTGSGNCATSIVEMDCSLPYNLFVPAMKAIPYMRTAPNGDLYMIRNACSTKVLNRNGVNGAGGSDFRTERQVCPIGYEVPQLWMLPKGTTGSPKGAADWVLVAENGTTGETNMGNNNNTHATLLEIVGNYLYIGFDNATNGSNIWRTDMTSVTSGTFPNQAAFSKVNIDGIDGSGTNQKLFSHVTVTNAGKDWLIIITRDGSNAMKIYRTANDQN